MAERRMFTKAIIDSDNFLDMPLSTQSLYFHLSMRADDDGFVNNPKKVMRAIGSNQNDIEILLAKRYVLGFESGVIVIKHWKLHNTIRKDRYKKTVYKEEFKTLSEKENGIYTTRQPIDNQLSTVGMHRLGLDKVRLEEINIKKINKKENSQPFETWTGKKESPTKTHKDTERERIQEIKQHWKSCTNLPQSKALDTNMNYSHDILNTMIVFPSEDIIQAINNLSVSYPKIEAKYRIKSFSNFMTVENIEKWYPMEVIESYNDENETEITEEQKKQMREIWD